MNALVTKLQSNRSGEAPKHLYAIAVAEDVSTCSRVKEFCRDLGRDLSPDCELIKHIWLLQQLRFPKLRAIAADEVFSADLIILSVHCEVELPAEIREWVELWLGRRHDHRAVFLALLDQFCGPEDPAKPMHPYLEEVAEKGDLELVVQSDEESGVGKSQWHGHRQLQALADPAAHRAPSDNLHDGAARSDDDVEVRRQVGDPADAGRGR